MKHILKPAFALFFIAVVSTVSLIAVKNATEKPIAENQKRTQEKMLREILVQASQFREVPVEAAFGSDGGSAMVWVEQAFEGLSGGETVGYVLQVVTREGYNKVDAINMMVGISATENTVAGVRILRQRETPGFGAKISKESFYGRFDGLALSPLTVVRGRETNAGDFQIIASSTITTRAVIGAFNKAIEWYNSRGGGLNEQPD
jgi:electron transport complex protein RnfG